MTYEEWQADFERRKAWQKEHPHPRCTECKEPRGNWPEPPPDEEQIESDLCPPCNRTLLGDLQSERRIAAASRLTEQ